MSYLFLKTLHVVAAIVFTGNIVVTALWKARADSTRDPRVIAFAQRLVVLTDYVFTGTGALVMLVTGLLMMLEMRWSPHRIPWLAWGLGLFAASGILWAAVLIPLQKKQSRMAREFAEGGQIPEAYWRLGRTWMRVGLLATLLPLAAVFFMVYKPV